MDASGCNLPFTYGELASCVEERTLQLWERLQRRKDIREAKIEKLEECPFCSYAMEILRDWEEDEEFRCIVCEVASCRRCRKKVLIFECPILYSPGLTLY